MKYFSMNLIQYIRILWYKYILSDIKIRPKSVIKSPTLFIGKGRIETGKKVNFGYYPSPCYYSGYNHVEARNSDAYIYIGDYTYINNNCCIISDHGSVHIGKNCTIGFNCIVLNSDFHGIKIEDRHNQDKIVTKDITIGDNVFIGNNVIILKGVKIGSGCVIGAGSVVTKSFSKNLIIAGNPAKIVRSIEQND